VRGLIPRAKRVRHRLYAWGVLLQLRILSMFDSLDLTALIVTLDSGTLEVGT
jgi:hypothetical protein